MASTNKIKEETAVLVSKNLAGLLSERLIVRRFEDIDPHDVKELAEILRSRVSLQNAGAGKFYTVTDPLVGGLKEEGVWRLISVKVIEPQVGMASIEQILAYGYADLLIDTEARLVAGSSRAIEPDKQLQRQYVALNFLKMKDMLAVVDALTSVLDPVIEGITYTGTYRVTINFPSRAEDGSGVITQTLVLGWVTTAGALPTPVLLDDKKVLLSPFVHDTSSQRGRHVYEYRGIDPAYAQTLRNTVSLSAGVVDATVIKAQDGSCSIQVLTETRSWAGTTSQEWGKADQYPTFKAERIVNTFKHIPVANLAAARSTLSSVPTNYLLTSLNDIVEDDSSVGLQQTYDRIFSGTPTANNGTDIQIKLDPYGADVLTTLWLRVPDSHLTAAFTTLQTAPAGYTTVVVETGYAGIGFANISRVLVKQVTDGAKGDITWPTFESERKSIHYLGYTDDAVMEAKYILLSTTCATGYKVDSVAKIQGQYGTITLIQSISKISITLTEVAGHDIGNEKEYIADGDVITRTWLHIPEASLAATITTLSSPPAGYTIAAIQNDFNGTGAANITRVCVKQNFTGVETQINLPNFKSEHKTIQYFGYTKATADIKYATLFATPPDGYTVVTVTKKEGRGGTIVLIQEIAKVSVAYAEDDGFEIQLEKDYIADGDVVTKTWLHVPESAVSATMTTLSTPPAGYTTALIRNDYSGIGSANITRVCVPEISVTPWERQITFPTFNSEKKVRVLMGLDRTTADALYLTYQTEVTAGYKVDDVQIVEGRLGTLTVVQIISKIDTVLSASVGREQSFDYSPFGLVKRQKQQWLNVPIVSVSALKTNIEALATKLVPDITDNDNGRGSVDISATVRDKPATPTSMGALQKTRTRLGGAETEYRNWHELNLKAYTPSEEVTKAFVGTAPYTVGASEEIVGASITDVGDLTGHVVQTVRVPPASYDCVEWTEQIGLDPQGRRGAKRTDTIRQYTDVLEADSVAVVALLVAWIGTSGDPEREKGIISGAFSESTGLLGFMGRKYGDPDWDNTTPTFDMVGKGNVGGIDEYKAELATAVPIGNAPAIIAAQTADAGYVLESVSYREGNDGDATITKTQFKTSTGIAVEVEECPGNYFTEAYKKTTWFRVDASSVAAIWATALTWNVVEGSYLLDYRKKTPSGEGRVDIENRVFIPGGGLQTTISTIGSDDFEYTSIEYKEDNSYAVGYKYRLVHFHIYDRYTTNAWSGLTNSAFGFIAVTPQSGYTTSEGSSVQPSGYRYLGLTVWHARRIEIKKDNWTEGAEGK